MPLRPDHEAAASIGVAGCDACRCRLLLTEGRGAMTIYALVLWAALHPPPPTTYRGLEACERAGRIAEMRARKPAPRWACVSLRKDL